MAKPTGRRTAIVSGLMAASAGAALASARRFYRASLPSHEGRAGLSGLRSPVEVVRDVHGVPHVRASTVEDAVAAEGFCHAQDRLWQLELVRRLARGRLAELLGPPGLGTDRLLRILGLARVADREAGQLQGAERAFVEAYCGGVNAFLRSPRFRPPFELRLLKAATVDPWTPGDALLAPKVLALLHGRDWEAEVVRARLRERLGPERAALVAPAVGAAPAGSTGWALAGSRTASGAPLLASETAFALALPSPWYVVDLAWRGGRAAGFSLPGTPGILVGRTSSVAWGLVDAEADTQDLFAVDLAEEPHTTRREEIRVRGRRRPHVEEVRTTSQGPVITALLDEPNGDLALAWTALEPADTAAGLLRLLGATSGEAVAAAATNLGGAAFELVWAEAEGGIGSRLVGGPLPRRGRGDGLVPADAADETARWQGTVPPDELPARTDGADGLLVAGETHDPGPSRAASYRPGRIRELFADRQGLTAEDCLAAQVDVRSIPGLRLQALLRGDEPELERPRAAHALLMAWDGELAADSAGAAVYGVLVRELATEVFRDATAALEGATGTDVLAELSSGLAFAGRSTVTLLELLERRDDAFFDDDRTWASVIAEALEHTAVELGERLGPDPAGWRWGDVHRLVLDHPLGRLPGLARVFRRGPFPLGGDGDTVFQAWQPPSGPHAGVRTVGPAMRFVADLADPDGSRFVLCGGQSGHPAADAYDDQVLDWLVGRARPLVWSDAALERDRASVLWLDPPI